MSIELKTLPRTVVKTYLSAARLPIDALARVRGEAGNQQWPPTLAFETLEAGVETVVGSLLRDDELVEAGRLRQAKVASLRKAAQLETLAETKRVEANEQFAAKRETAQRQKAQADAQARQLKQQIEREAEQQAARAEAKAAKKAAAARATKNAQEQLIERRERAVTAVALDKEASALAVQQEALDAAETVEVIDETLEGSREARRTN
jgi:regulator of protease activity HflC (stomatin/prohibitin superfamily)